MMSIFFYVRQQLVDEHEFEVTQDGATMGKRYRRIKDPKGNANYSIRPIELTPYNRNIIEQMLALHEPSPYLFTCQGRPLITDTVPQDFKSCASASSATAAYKMNRANSEGVVCIDAKHRVTFVITLLANRDNLLSRNGTYRARTYDPLLVRQMLSQLS